MDRTTALEFASAADRHFQIAELPAQPVLSDLPAPFLARWSRREEAYHLALHHHVPQHLASASYWRPYWPFCNRSHCQTVNFLKEKFISISATPKTKTKKLGRHGKGRKYIYLIHSSSTTLLLVGNALRKPPYRKPIKPCHKISVSLSLIIHLTKQTRIGWVLCGACIVHSTWNNNNKGVVYGKGEKKTDK